MVLFREIAERASDLAPNRSYFSDPRRRNRRSMKFPYGLSDFATLIQEGYFYQDRTDRIPQSEEAGRQLIFIRPRRFGKRAWNGSSGGCWRGNLPFPEGTCPIVLPGEL